MDMRRPKKPKTKIYKFPLDLRPTMYRAIGEYIARAARLEYQLIYGISYLAGIKDKKKMRISFMGMTFDARLGTFKALATYWAPSARMRRQIHNIVKAARNIRVVRNSMAHGLWGYEKGGKRNKVAVYFAPTSADYYLPRTTHYTAEKIRSKAGAIRSLDRRLGRVLDKISSSQRA